LYSRNLNDISRKYPSVCQVLAKIKDEAVLDGEFVALDEHGRSRFQLLQNAGREPARVLYCVFDLLYLDGKDLRGKTLLERKAALREPCRRARSCFTASMSSAKASRPSTAPSAPTRKASWPSSPAANTTPVSAPANG